MYRYIKVFCIFFIVTANVYSQKKDCSCRPIYFYMTGDRVIYTDSIIVDGVTVYTDSFIVDVTVVPKGTTVSDATVASFSGDSIVFYKADYPFTLTDNPPFKNAIFRDDCEFLHQMRLVVIRLWRQEADNLPEEKKGYYILSAENRYINYGFLTKEEGELYAKYNPENDMKSNFSFSKRQYGKLIHWVKQEMDKGMKVSIGSKNQKTYVAKSFGN